MATSFTISMSAVASGTDRTKTWTPTTLATAMAQGLARNANEDTVIADIRDTFAPMSYESLWTMWDWWWRVRWTTKTITASSETFALTTNVAGFEKFPIKWLRETNDNGPLRITHSVSDFDAWRHAHKDSEVVPLIAVVEPDTSLGSFGVQMRFAPTPGSAYSFKFPYLCRPPVLGSGDTPSWPDFMHRLWFMCCQWMVEKQYLGEEGPWKSTYGGFKGAFQEAVRQNDEYLSFSTEEIPVDGSADSVQGCQIDSPFYGGLISRDS